MDAALVKSDNAEQTSFSLDMLHFLVDLLQLRPQAHVRKGVCFCCPLSQSAARPDA